MCLEATVRNWAAFCLSGFNALSLGQLLPEERSFQTPDELVETCRTFIVRSGAGIRRSGIV